GPSLYRSDRRSGACFLSSCCVLTCLRPVKCDSRHFPVPDSSRHKLALSAVQSECLVTNLSLDQSTARILANLTPQRIDGSHESRIYLSALRSRYPQVAGAMSAL